MTTSIPVSALRRLRQRAGLRLLDVAIQTGIDPGHLSKMERNQRGVTLGTIAKLVPVLDLSKDDIAEIIAEAGVE